MRKVFADTCHNLVSKDPKVMILLGDIGVHSLRQTFVDFPDNIINIGILEQAMIGAAAGISAQGLIPIVHTIAPFIVERALEQIKVDLAYQNLGANLVSVGNSYDYAGLGATHHCPGDIGILSNVPGVQLFIPGSQEEFRSQLTNNYSNGEVSYFRLSEFSHSESFSLSNLGAAVLRTGGEITVISIGPIITETLEALQNTSATLIYINSLNPLDLDLIRKNVDEKLLIVSNLYKGTVTPFLFPILENKKVKIRELGTPRMFLRNYGSKNQHDMHNELDAKSILRAYTALVDS